MTNEERQQVIEWLKRRPVMMAGAKRMYDLAVEALEQAPTALDHIHNVVAEREYKRGYERAKAEYNHKLTVIKNTNKDYYYINGYEHGKADAVPKWIPVSERLPEEGYDVLITKEPFKIKGYEQEVIIAKRSVDPRSGKIGWWSEFGALKDKAVIAWMPLPEPYKEGVQQ